MGLKFGCTEKEVAHMYLGKWMELFQVHKKVHNMEMKRGLYEINEKVSLLDI